MVLRRAFDTIDERPVHPQVRKLPVYCKFFCKMTYDF
jgi:hypothetical protein